MECVVCKDNENMKAIAFDTYWCGVCGALDREYNKEVTVYRATATREFIENRNTKTKNKKQKGKIKYANI